MKKIPFDKVEVGMILRDYPAGIKNIAFGKIVEIRVDSHSAYITYETIKGDTWYVKKQNMTFYFYDSITILEDGEVDLINLIK